MLKVKIEGAFSGRFVEVEGSNSDVVVSIFNNGSFQAITLTSEAAKILSDTLATAAKKAATRG